MLWKQKDDSKREQPNATWVIAALGVVVVGIATYMNYGSSFKSHAAPVETTTAPDTK